jgi:nicotinamide riboside kinase
MKIAVSGAHAQGKSTLCADLMQLPEFKNFKLLGNITRDLKSKGIEINEKGSDWTQTLVIAKHIEHALTPGNVLLDRCILDGCVYTRVLYQNSINVSSMLLDFAHYVFNKLISLYDVIFYIEPTLPLKEDGVRSTKPLFFDAVVLEFEKYLGACKNCYRIEGSREKRVQQVLQILKENYAL